MTPADLEILVQQGEGTTLEFKESLSSSFAREVVAPANTVGGRILLGVRDDGDRHFFPEAYITCLLGRGTDKVHILDRKDFDGGIVADVEDAMRFVERNTRTAYRIEGLRRQNIPE